MKPIQLKLDKTNWFFFDSKSQRFRLVKNKRNFRHGDLLYKDSQFFLVRRKKKIVAISWCEAGKKIYGKIQDFTRRSFKVSSQKMIFAFGISADEEVQVSLKPDTYPFPYERVEPVVPRIPRVAEQSNLTTAEQRAKKIMHQTVYNNPRLSIKGNDILIKSKNGKTYRISMLNGFVYNGDERSVCVTMRYIGERIPLCDQILAKALTIAYAPKRISTLN